MVKLKLYGPYILVGVLASFIVDSVWFWLVSDKTHSFILTLMASSIAALVTAWLVYKRFNQDFSVLSDRFDNVAIGTAEISYSLDQLQKRIHHQAELSDRSASIIHKVSANSAQLSAVSRASLDAAAATGSKSKEGQLHLKIIAQKIQEANLEARNEANHSNDAAALVLGITRKIERITDVVRDVAFETNLLSLNAAIQAAQAGEHGKAFGVIATEIRKLSAQTTLAIQDIHEVLKEINVSANDSASIVQSMAEKMNGMTDSSNEIHRLLEGISATAISTEQHTAEMADNLEEYVETTNDVSETVLAVKNALDVLANESKQASQYSASLTSISETIHPVLSKFGIKNNRHDSVRDICTKLAKGIQKVFESAIASGQLSQADVFDRQYRPIPNTNPQKYHTKFDTFTDSVFPALQEAALNQHEYIVFVITTDINGYVPTHNNQFSYAPTGNYQVDLVRSRSKRIFSDPVGSRCGSHTEPFLLQTYKRDTAQIMHDLSVPVYVNGEHWGGVRIGYLAGFDQLAIDHNRLT